jgi:hypothetical protein
LRVAQLQAGGAAHEGERVDDLKVVLVDVFDFEMNSVHLIDSFNYLVLLWHRLLLCVNMEVLKS